MMVRHGMKEPSIVVTVLQCEAAGTETPGSWWQCMRVVMTEGPLKFVMVPRQHSKMGRHEVSNDVEGLLTGFILVLQSGNNRKKAA